MSYLVVTCKRCGRRKILSLKGRPIPRVTACPYCSYRISVKDAHFVVFNDYEKARSYWLQGIHRRLVSQ